MKYAAVFSADHCLFNEKRRCNAYSALLAGELQRGNILSARASKTLRNVGNDDAMDESNYQPRQYDKRSGFEDSGAPERLRQSYNVHGFL